MKLGTILPSPSTIQTNVLFATRQAKAKREVAKRFGLTEGNDNGYEVRYYNTNRLYAVIGRDMIPHWFEVRENGDFPVRVQ